VGERFWPDFSSFFGRSFSLLFLTVFSDHPAAKTAALITLRESVEPEPPKVHPSNFSLHHHHHHHHHHLSGHPIPRPSPLLPNTNTQYNHYSQQRRKLKRVARVSAIRKS
jgi:hypothetical protein